MFTADDNVNAPIACPELSVVTESLNKMLTAEVTFEEFTCALQLMPPDKASRPDGFSPRSFSTSGTW